MEKSEQRDVLVIVPTRSRPEGSVAFAEAFFAHSTRSALLFALDDDDPELTRYTGIPGAQYEVNPRLRLVGTLNLIASKYYDQYRYLAFMGDDHRIRTPGWDQLLVEAIDEVPAGIAYGNDLHQGANLPTAVLMNAAIVRTLGFMAPPDLIHSFKDNFWRDLGQRLGSLRYCNDVVIEHLHWVVGKADHDAVYQESNHPAAVARDQVAYDRYVRTRLRLDAARFQLSNSGTSAVGDSRSRQLSETGGVPSVGRLTAYDGLLRTDFSGFADLAAEGANSRLQEAADTGRQASLPLICGLVHLLDPLPEPVVGSWVSNGIAMRMIASQSLETLTISGRMSWGVGEAAPLLVRLNGTLHAATFDEGSPVFWTLPCVVPESEEFVIEIQPGRVARLPQTRATSPRELGFLLTRIAFQSDPIRELIHDPVGMKDHATLDGPLDMELPVYSGKKRRFSLLCPTRNRPEGVLRLVFSALKCADDPELIEFVFYLDEDDDTFPDLTDLGANVRIVRGPRLIMSEMWNKCAAVATGDYLMLAADDFEFRTPGWDSRVHKDFERWPDGIVLIHGNDLTPHGESLATHFFISRRWVEIVGYFTPAYFSCDYADTWVSDIAQYIDRKAYLSDVVIEHHHPNYGKAVRDRSHLERMERGQRDDAGALYVGLAPLRRIDAEKLTSAYGTPWIRNHTVAAPNWSNHWIGLKLSATMSREEHPGRSQRAAEPMLSILVYDQPTHAGLITRLLNVLLPQVDAANGAAEILVNEDENLSVEAMVNALLDQAAGDYVAFIRGRDMITRDYVGRLLNALQSSPDMVAIELVTNCADHGFVRTLTSLKHDETVDAQSSIECIRLRPPGLENPVRRSIAMSARRPDASDCKEREYLKRLAVLLRTETVIEGPIYVQL